MSQFTVFCWYCLSRFYEWNNIWCFICECKGQKRSKGNVVYLQHYWCEYILTYLAEGKETRVKQKQSAALHHVTSTETLQLLRFISLICCRSFVQSSLEYSVLLVWSWSICVKYFAFDFFYPFGAADSSSGSHDWMSAAFAAFMICHSFTLFF